MKKTVILIWLMVAALDLFSQSQSQLLKGFSAKELWPAGVAGGKVEVKNKVWPITIEWSGNDISKIVLLRAGVLEEIHAPNIPGYPSYFYNGANRICFIDGVFVYYTTQSNEILISYVLSPDKDKLSSVDPSALRQKLSEYFLQVSSQQNTAREEYKSDINAEKEKEKLAHSLKGKSIKSMEIVWLTNESQTGMQSQISFGVKAIDANGKVFSTDNIGGKTPWDDFEITCTGAVPGDGKLTVDTDASKIPGDKATVRVKSKHHASLVASSSINIAFNTPVKLSYAGKHGCPPLTSGTGTGGGRGSDAMLNVCNSADGMYVLIEVYINGVSVHKVKLQKGVALYLDISGGPGCSGRSEKGKQGGKGGSGGAGGSLIINKDPSTTGDNIIYYTNGGRGGKGGDGVISGDSGRNGDDGSVIVNSKSIKLNF